MRREKGTGTIIRKRGTFRIRLRSQGIDRLDPRQFDTRAEAERAWADLQAKTRSIPRPQSPIPTVAQLSALMMDGVYGRSIESTTFGANDLISRNHIERDPIGKLRVDRVTTAACQAWVDRQVATKSRKDGKRILTWTEPAAPTTIRRRAAYLGRVLTEAVTQGWISTNPMTAVVLPKVNRHRRNRVLEPSEVGSLLGSNHRVDVAMLMAAVGGLRRSELLKLRWDDIDFQRRLVHVPGSKSVAAARTVPLMDALATALKNLPRPSEWVFGTSTGKPMSKRNLNRDVNLRKAALGIPRETRLQDLRGTFISLLIDQGVGIRNVMEMVGHADPKTTLVAYARGFNASKLGAIDALEQALVPTPPSTKTS